MRSSALILTGVLLVLASFPTRADPLIYATGKSGIELLVINAKTGETRVVGKIGHEGSAPLAFGSDGKLYTITDSMKSENAASQLAVIDPVTGQASLVGEPLGKTIRAMALGTAPDGTLYAGGLIDNMLYRIDPQTGALTEVGQFKGGKDVMDFAVHPKDGTIYAVSVGELYKLDPQTATLTKVGDITKAHPSIMGIVFDEEGTLYALNYAEKTWLYRLDPVTAKAEKIADVPARGVHSADIVPMGR